MTAPTKKPDEDNAVEETIEELLVDPDAPERGNTTPPQTIDAEPEVEKGRRP